ncbi:MAG: hypothetical protein PHP98_08050 [Kiritimatiellae bacterium]|jgi:hypothetical protein|nr:hypothetical protein [Kiritimatiellia bacterium]
MSGVTRVKKRGAGLLLFFGWLFLAGNSPAANGLERAAPALPATNGQEAVEEGGASALEVGVRPRDPFWPVGFYPSASAGAAASDNMPGTEGEQKKNGQPPDSAEILRIGGVVKKGNTFYATVNGLTVKVGEVISAVAGGSVYKFVVESIDFNKVRFKPVK